MLETLLEFSIYLSCFVRNYFDSPLKLFSDLHLAKFLDTSTKSFFPYNFAKLQYNIEFNTGITRRSLSIIYLK